MRHNYWACALEPGNCNYWAHMPQLLKTKRSRVHAPQREKPPPWKVWAPQLESDSHLPRLEESLNSNRDSAQTKTKKEKNS